MDRSLTPMSHEERNTIVGVISNLLVNSYFIWRVHMMFVDGTSVAPDGVMIWAREVIWVIPGGIILTIVMVILANILWAIFTGETKPSFLVDERDRGIQINGMATTMVVTVLGFLASIAALAYGISNFIAFNIVFFSLALGSLSGDLSKLWLYRRSC